jgi:polyhydroxyalkanoate synthesis regulator phasin
MQDALRTYLELALGLTEASRKTVQKVVKDIGARSGATADQARALTSELMSMNAANREALVKLVRFEVDRALGAVGLATAEQVSDLTARLRELERQLAEAETRLAESATASRRRAAATKAAATRATQARAKKATKTAKKVTKTTAKKATKATATSAPRKRAVPATATSPARTAASSARTAASPARTAARPAPARRASQTEPDSA